MAIKTGVVIGRGWAYGTGTAKDFKPGGTLNERMKKMTLNELA